MANDSKSSDNVHDRFGWALQLALYFHVYAQLSYNVPRKRKGGNGKNISEVRGDNAPTMEAPV